MNSPIMLALWLATNTPGLQANAPANPPGVTFTIRFAEDKTSFRPEEIIRLKLEITSEVVDAYHNAGGYSTDARGRQQVETYDVDPREGVSDPLYDFIHSFSGYGFSGSFVVGIDHPSRVLASFQQDLNEWVRFTKPGHYRVHVVSKRIEKGPANRPPTREPALLTSNALEFDILPEDPDWVETAFRDSTSLLEAKAKDDRVRGCRILRFLDSPAAVKEMARRFGRGDPECDALYRFGLVGTLHRNLAIEELANNLESPEQPVSSLFLDSLVTLSTLHNPQSADQVRMQYLTRLAAAIPLKAGHARGVSINTVIQFISAYPPGRYPIVDGLVDRIPGLLAEVFLELPIDTQYDLLNNHWQRIRSDRMLAAVRRVYETAENAIWTIHDIALQRIYESDAEEGRRLIMQEIESPQPKVSIRAFGLLREETLPQFDRLFADRLRQSAESGSEDTTLWARLIERYATAAILPDVRAVLDKPDGGECEIQSSLIAYVLRVDSGQGAEIANHALASRSGTGCYRDLLMNIANLHMNADLEQIAIARLYDGDPDVLMSAAEALRAHGSSASLQYLWNRFEQWHEEWKRYEPELRDAWPSRFPEAQPLGMQAFVELALIRAIAEASHPTLDSQERNRLRALCLTRNGQRSVESLARDK